MFVVSLKPKPTWHPSYRMKRMKLLDKEIEVNLPNIITEEMVGTKILKLNVNKPCAPDKIHSQILIELVDLVSKPLAVHLNRTMDEGCIPHELENDVRFTNIQERT